MATVEESLMGPKDLSSYLGVPVATIYRWNYEGSGPVPLKVGQRLRYRRSDVEAWLKSREKR